ncbi:protein MCM10 homolog isoform X1 [Labrus mixtus]|uniref:protein MCM10 homolog isoform X1 n=1 Tax=Labrus mixtus TaxID=508554 RepID=UPI0029BFDC6A|nr:protein MCM10 homolog isoform X1 [Labrus mixtus]XP_060886039.1 protein MCM10 homolog isoform X1 [Labrus mixtus]
MDSEDDLDVLTALLAESEGVTDDQEQDDDLDGLFDDDNNEGEEYKEGAEEGSDLGEGDSVSELFGDVDDIENEVAKEKESEGGKCESLDRSTEDLQGELKRMQEQMQRLQQQLEASQKSSSVSPVTKKGSSASPKPVTPNLKNSKLAQTKPATSTQKTKTQAAAASSSPPEREAGLKLHESSDFLDQLSNADSFKRKPRVAHTAKLSTSPEERGPLVEIKIGSSFQPVEGTSKVTNPLRSPPASQSRASPAASAGQHSSLPPLPKDVAVEKYSGLRLRKPRVSSSEMDRKMADRRLIRLSQVPERLTREKLEDSDWVTFAVLVNKVTPQSSSSGKTFSIWKLNDLHNLEVFVSLLLFGEVHKEHWKTEPGTVIGILNPNPMKQKEGYDGVSLTVDHAQKVLLLGEAQDYGTCKAAKKNGDPCSQIVNLYECQYCQYHVKAQYKKMSSKRADLQSSFSGKAPNKVKGKAGGGLRERLCQDGFYYGGVSSAACAASITASKPNKPGQKTLDKMFVKGSAQHIKKLAVQSGEVSGCSSEFKSLLSMPTPGALQLKRHLTQGGQSGPKDVSGAPVQSITASDLLKQQKQMQRELQQTRKRRAEEIQNRVLQSSAGSRPTPAASSSSSSSSSSSHGRGGLLSPKAASEATRSPVTPHTPTLGRGFSEGDDILFFENSPPPAPASSALSLSAAKLAALKRLRNKGKGLEKEDPNAVKRKRSNDSTINARVEKNLTSPKGESGQEEEEPAQKKKREQLDYVQSDEFQKILNAKSRHGAVLQAAEYQLQERYFDPLVKKEQMEEKMKGVREMKCRAVTCKKCSYTYFKPADRCVEQKHDLHWHDAMKRFFKCPCGQRAIALDRLPNKHCSNCGLFKWERDGMLKEKTGPKIGGELLLPRGEEHGRFLNSMQ